MKITVTVIETEKVQQLTNRQIVVTKNYLMCAVDHILLAMAC